jgi:alpha-methylacyl-CoA racemase
MTSTHDRPLHGVRVVELAALGPAPFAAMLLADLGADVVRVTRPRHGAPVPGTQEPLLRGRSTIEADLKSDEGRARVLELSRDADVLIEGHRPGVMERLGLAPGDVLPRNPALVYARVTGYGQDGPLARRAGHDINYIAIAGVLGALRRGDGRPAIPLNLVGDFGGGGMLAAFGIVSALFDARRSGKGRVLDVAMADGASLLATSIHELAAAGAWDLEAPGTNIVDGGAHFYDVYETADGRHMAVGAIEPQFYAELLDGLDLPIDELPQWDRERWPDARQRLADVFATRTRAAWTEHFADRDACVTPVLDLAEARQHPHNVARGAFSEIEGRCVPSPAPRFVPMREEVLR